MMDDYTTQLVRKVTYIRDAFVDVWFSQTKAREMLRVGKPRLLQLIEQGKIRVATTGDTKSSTWRCNGSDIIELIMSGKARQQVKLKI